MCTAPAPPPVVVPPAEPDQPPVVTPPAAARTETLGIDGRDTLTLNHLAHALVDGGDGKDRITLGADHSDVTVRM